MNEILHVSSQFDEDLSRLRTHVLQMGGLVENQVSAVIDAYASGDPAGVGQILETDRKINALEKTIDDDCAQIIARRQPTASDLRLVFGVTKIVTDLERAGDEAKKIAKGVRRLHADGVDVLAHAPVVQGQHVPGAAEVLALERVAQLHQVIVQRVGRGVVHGSWGGRSDVGQPAAAPA